MEIIKKVSKSGTINFGRQIRDLVNIQQGSAVKIEVEGNRVVVTPYQPICKFCGTAENVVFYKEIEICRKHLAAVQMEGNENE